ncbi:Catechol 2,3-dioxygenase [Maribacter sedimenticola]|uniref:Catechol 2,3-dioxygenase n=1 Tax=Maribacter sedimenticola TaxID=228956 RepID=A0ABY1SFL0_9FLAO|nr:VOC family protein [Maribacter sedimenticola]SNR42368.1 Catechol 2,3-dioxygenase [Maribacter sedimenticola]
MVEVINGIQQIGIGVLDTKTVFNWYRKHLGFNVLLFKDEAVASLMTRYTNGKAEKRDAYLSLNLMGGGGLEIWQFKDRLPAAAQNDIVLGDLGIYAMKIRCKDLVAMHGYLEQIGVLQLTDIIKTLPHSASFYFDDPFGNKVQMVQDSYMFSAEKSICGGVMGAVIGVSNMEQSIEFYKRMLGYTVVLYDDIETNGTAANKKYRKVILGQNRKHIGGFGDLLGPTQLELVEMLQGTPTKIFKDRLWGDLGYIHLCFDVQGMDSLREKAKILKTPFTVDSSNSFDMGDAAGHFSYIEDPDGTLIELVETHKVPIVKSLGIYLNLKKRDPYKTLPKWLVKSLGLHKVSKDL